MQKIKKGDKVIVLTVKDKGKTAEVIKAMPKENKVVIQGVNVVKKHQKPTQGNPGGIVTKELPIDASNVAIVDPKDGKPTRVGFKFLKDGKKVRFAKRSGDVIDS